MPPRSTSMTFWEELSPGVHEIILQRPFVCGKCHRRFRFLPDKSNCPGHGKSAFKVTDQLAEIKNAPQVYPVREVT